MEETITSEFGKGFVYSLILFAKHFERWEQYAKSNSAEDLWFNGAADHLYELEIPEQWKDKEFAHRLRALQDLAIGWRLDRCTEADFRGFWKDLEEVAREIDKELGLNPIKAEWNQLINKPLNK